MSLFSHTINKIFKYINSFIFFILPKKVTSVYVTLSILAFIYNIRSEKLTTSNIKLETIEKGLKIGISDDLLIFPEYSLDLLWEHTVLYKTFKINSNLYNLKEIILNNNLLHNNLQVVLNTLIDELPRGIKNNLNLNNYINKKLLEHQIEEALLI